MHDKKIKNQKPPTGRNFFLGSGGGVALFCCSGRGCGDNACVGYRFFIPLIFDWIAASLLCEGAMAMADFMYRLALSKSLFEADSMASYK